MQLVWLSVSFTQSVHVECSRGFRAATEKWRSCEGTNGDDVNEGCHKPFVKPKKQTGRLNDARSNPRENSFSPLSFLPSSLYYADLAVSSFFLPFGLISAETSVLKSLAISSAILGACSVASRLASRKPRAIAGGTTNIERVKSVVGVPGARIREINFIQAISRVCICRSCNFRVSCGRELVTKIKCRVLPWRIAKEMIEWRDMLKK